MSELLVTANVHLLAQRRIWLIESNKSNMLQYGLHDPHQSAYK